ncbi:MAG: glucoamylase family protein [Bacillota bacterium]
MEALLFVLIIGLLLIGFSRYKNIKDDDTGAVKDVLLQPEQLLSHAAQMAREHTVSKSTKHVKSLPGRIDNNFKAITEVYKRINTYAKKGRDLTPASEWLLDNYYKIEEQVKEVRQSLTRERLRKLSILKGGILKGYPRVYAIALELISHTDGRLDQNLLIDFVRAYQSHSKLSSAEVWSLSLMTRLALIENIRYICERIHKTQQQWERAGRFVKENGNNLLLVLREQVKDKKGLNPSFIEHLLRRLRKDGIDSGEIIDLIDDRLFDYGLTVKDLIEQEHKDQAARKISVGNAITSLNVVAVLDWNDIFESLCAIHEILKDDPVGVYPGMDFESRDYYRKLIEKIAQRARVPQISVARKALECARRSAAEGGSERESHIGYYIAGGGRKELMGLLGMASAGDRFHNYSLSSYLIIITVITLAITVGLLYYSYALVGEEHILLNLLIALVALLPASDVAINLVNWCFTHGISPTFLPKLEYRDGIPDSARTLVAIPTLLPDKKKVREHIDHLEVYYHANREKNLYFALAGDFKDADKKAMPGDEEIIREGLEGIRLLNEKYSDNGDLFFFLVRHRQHSEKQDKWMGWERKRGALLELNALLCGSKDTSYSVVSGNISGLGTVKYVITLDADTNLTMDTAKKLIGTISHPLNRAVCDEDASLIRDGYGIIQPRIRIDVESANRSAFTRVFAGQGGIDPYTTAISDIYQDLFGEGIFTGKGIYDVDVFNRVLKGAFPDNSVLSHDLLEGSFARTALATDIELIDGYPSGYGSYMMRLHRWVRGDWQLIRWLCQRVRNREGKESKNPLSLLSRWKILDNLRRSLVPVFQFLLVVLGILIFPGNAGVWVLFSAITVGFRFLLGVVDHIMLGSHSGFGEKLNGNVISGLKATAYQAFLLFVFLPYHVYITADGIIRSLHRVFVSGRNMLEWVTASEVERSFKNDRLGYAKKMGLPALLSAAVLVLALSFKPQGLPYVLVIGILWVMSPRIAYRISVVEGMEELDLSSEETEELRKLSRKTWAYYEDFVNAENNYLAPDNVQVEPPNGVAHRTSPTNIGFMLISTLSARDFGYISTSDMVDRIEHSIDTIEGMETWRGHLYNWYDTKTLEVLRPYFVSTVDSGNLVGYLICLRQGLKEYAKNPVIHIGRVRGLLDTALLVEEGAEAAIDMLDRALGEGSITLSEWCILLAKLEEAVFDADSWEIRLNKTVASFIKETRDLFPDRDLLDKVYRLIGGRDDYKKVLALIEEVEERASLTDLLEVYDRLIKEMDGLQREPEQQKDAASYISRLRVEVLRCRAATKALLGRMDVLMDRIGILVDATEFAPLYDTTRHLFSIGYNVGEENLINSYYDLLASEARITSYIAIARREVPKKHWFKLGRALSVVDGYRGLVSWAGTMFEYLMPLLVLKNYKNTLLDETYGTIVKAQKSYGDKRNAPWGISESGYYAFDMLFNYQYKAFGVPDFGLKRGLAEDMVVSPYSTLLALPVNPRLAVDNIKRLKKEGLEGEYGFYEAVDYTPDRLPRGKRSVLVKSYMAHHQGMGFISLNNYLNCGIIQKRFHGDPVIRAAEILLQEKMPLKVIITKEYKEEIQPLEVIDREEVKVIRIFGVPDTPVPQCHMLSNGSYSLMLTNGGGGYSRKDSLQVTRWREDPLEVKHGTFVFLRNLNTKKVWSSTHQPLGGHPDGYMAIFSQDRAEYYRTDDNIDTHSEIVVTTEDNAEIRRISLTNHGNGPAVVELTSYMEPVLAAQAADIAHPAFSNLFVRTEYISQYDSLLASRRPRVPKQETLWAVHTMAVEGETAGSLQYETIRGNFIGRGRDITNPAGLTQPLTNTVGIVLDPVMCLRRKVKVEPGKVVKISFVTSLTGSREEAISLAAKYHNPASIDRAFDLALTRSQVETTYLNLRAGEIKTYQNMISQIVFASPARRKYQDIIRKNAKGQSGLWSYGVSGDIPIVLVSIDRTEHAELVKECLKAHEYWRFKGLPADLVILNRDGSSYLQPLQELVNEIVLSSNGRDVIDKPGGVHILNSGIMPEEDIVLIHAAARIILKGGEGPIDVQLKGLEEEEDLPRVKSFNRYDMVYEGRDYPLEVTFFNGYGGFTSDGREYIVRLKENSHTPAPWTNVISNEGFGFLVSESGSGSVWAENSRENKLTPWSNDPVTDPPGEIIYLRDEENGDLWTITPLPIRDDADYTIRHGLGYSSFHHLSHGIDQNLTMFVPKSDPVKISVVKLKNDSNKKRHLSITYYIRPVLGISDQLTQQYIETEYDSDSQTFFIRNPFNYDFPGRIAFVATSDEIGSCTGDRAEFLGTGESLANPKALSRECLSNRTGVGYDPCVAVQTFAELKAGEEKELVFLLGQVPEEGHLRGIVEKYNDPDSCRRALEEVKEYWEDTLGVIRVYTPDASMDLMLNYWLMYQTIACRLWARTAFYQSGGAYGFRDQLQDAVNVVYALPQLTRRQVLVHCAHQFVEGDVQHWWHPGIQEKGIRTRFTDDLLWLPYTVAEYIKRTGDYSILNEEAHYLEDLPLDENEDERYGTPRISEERSSVYEHCVRAIERGLRCGEHGIPLMGSGDWNDGMSTVGNKGKGESIWLGWFLCDTLKKFLPACDSMKDTERKERFSKAVEDITRAIEQNGWDGSWYRRAYFDDGTPLGSSENTECTIDSIAQSWAVISGQGDPNRVVEAMNAVEHYLVRRGEGIILLFTPPFDESELEPGYIKGYVPGVRENGGQYTHAASWVMKAFAMLGNGDKAWELFNMINPVNHARTPIECATYKVEPYVAAADVYAVAPHSGRGGWTWYTGAAGWLYRVGLESLLGFNKEGGRLRIQPCIPREWAGYSMEYRYKGTRYHIEVKNPDKVSLGVREVTLDEKVMQDGYIPLSEDGSLHRVQVILGDTGINE